MLGDFGERLASGVRLQVAGTASEQLDKLAPADGAVMRVLRRLGQHCRQSIVKAHLFANPATQMMAHHLSVGRSRVRRMALTIPDRDSVEEVEGKDKGHRPRIADALVFRDLRTNIKL